MPPGTGRIHSFYAKIRSRGHIVDVTDPGHELDIRSTVRLPRFLVLPCLAFARYFNQIKTLPHALIRP